MAQATRQLHHVVRVVNRTSVQQLRHNQVVHIASRVPVQPPLPHHEALANNRTSVQPLLHDQTVQRTRKTSVEPLLPHHEALASNQMSVPRLRPHEEARSLLRVGRLQLRSTILIFRIFHIGLRTWCTGYRETQPVKT